MVYCKPPFKDSAHAVEYLGRYTHKVAISNNRIEHCENELVTFKWKDYKDKNRTKHMTLNVNEFIRRFLFHILPDRFVKIRYYGFLSNRNRNLKLKHCKRLTGTQEDMAKTRLSLQKLVQELTGKDPTKCTVCGSGNMIKIGILHPRVCSPPVQAKTA